MANKLNMAIAKTNRLSSRVIGMQLTGGTFAAIALSALQMSVGFVFIGGKIINGNFLIGVLVGFIGVVLAVLVERLSLGGLSAVRVAQSNKKQLELAYYQLESPTEQQKSLFDRRSKDFGHDITTGWIFGGVGMSLSAGVGDVFWHNLFQSLTPEWFGYVLSFACAAVIGLTFIHSELFKALMDSVLKEILIDMSLMTAAVAVEEENMRLDMMVDAFDAVRNDAEVRAPAENKIKQTIGRRLTGFASRVSSATEQVANYNMSVVDSTLAPPRTQLALPAPRGKYAQHRDELYRLLRANPGLSQKDIAQHFQVSKSTANAWYGKLQRGE